MIDTDLLRLDAVGQQYLGLSPRVANNKAAQGTLPFPAFRLSGTRCGPLFVRKTDVDAWISERIAEAEELNSAMKSVGAV